MKTSIVVLIFLAFCVTGCVEKAYDGSSDVSLPKDMDLWLIAGQSNTHCGMFGQDGCDEPLKNIWMLNMDGTWMRAVEPLHRIYDTSDPGMRENVKHIFKFSDEQCEDFRQQTQQQPCSNVTLVGTGFAMPFARIMNKELNRPIGLVPCGLGATSMSHWDPAKKDDPNSLYGFMLRQAAKAGKPVKGVLWYQGEGDSGMEMSKAYRDTMLNFIDSLRVDLQQFDLPFLLVQLGRFADTTHSQSGWDAVQESQRVLPQLRENVWVTTAVDLPLDDMIHVSTEGHQLLGKRLAHIVLGEVYGKKGYGRMIQPERIEKVDPNSILKPPCFGKPEVWRVHFSGVSGSFVAEPFPNGFEVRSAEGSDTDFHMYRVEIDPEDSHAVLLYVSAAEEGMELIYAPGSFTFVNLRDEKGMAVPAFGPVTLPLEGKVEL